MGPKCTDEPVLMLAGLLKQPSILVSHFFTVAFISIRVQLSATPWSQIYMFPINSVRVFWTACVVILPYLYAEFTS